MTWTTRRDSGLLKEDTSYLVRGSPSFHSFRSSDISKPESHDPKIGDMYRTSASSGTVAFVINQSLLHQSGMSKDFKQRSFIRIVAYEELKTDQYESVDVPVDNWQV